MFGKSSNIKLPEPKYTTGAKDEPYPWTDDERQFFIVFMLNLSDDEKSRIRLVSLSSGAIEPYYLSYPLGKVKARGRKYYIQTLIDEKTHETEQNVQFLIDFIPKMTDYLRKVVEK